MTIIYVIDTETTGLEGAPNDSVVEIGIAAIDTAKGFCMPIYDQVIWQYLPPKKYDSWVFQNTDLSVDDVLNGKHGWSAADYFMQLLLTGQKVTSYNTAFDFDLFLDRWPYYMGKYTKRQPCIMLAASTINNIPRRHAGEGSYCRLIDAYSVLCPEDPMGMQGRQDHRAVSDAVMAGYVLLKLIKGGAYHVI